MNFSPFLYPINSNNTEHRLVAMIRRCSTAKELYASSQMDSSYTQICAQCAQPNLLQSPNCKTQTNRLNQPPRLALYAYLSHNSLIIVIIGLQAPKETSQLTTRCELESKEKNLSKIINSLGMLVSLSVSVAMDQMEFHNRSRNRRQNSTSPRLK